MILFEVVLFGIGLQVKVWDRGNYGKYLTYFEINAGNKGGAPWIFKKLFFNLTFAPAQNYMLGAPPAGKCLSLNFCKWHWRKEWGVLKFVEPIKPGAFGELLPPLQEKPFDGTRAVLGLRGVARENLLKHVHDLP